MMEIGLADGLRKFAKLPPLPPASEEDALFCWDVTRIQEGGRSLLVMVNASNRACAITRMTAADWKRIDEMAAGLVRAALETSGLRSWDVENYMRAAGEAKLTRTHGKVAVGGLNRVANCIWLDEVDMSERVQWELMGYFNEKDFGTRSGRDGYGHAFEWLLDDMHVRGLLDNVEPAGPGCGVARLTAKQ